jgi:thiosulfate dehydrogenase
MYGRSRPLYRWVTAGLICAALGIAAGVAAGYWRWGAAPDWYRTRDIARLPPGPQNDLIAYGYRLVTQTQRHIGPDVVDAAMRFAGNNLACGDCHLRAGLRPWAAPFVSTYTSFPMMVDDRVITLSERIEGCMTRSMDGRKLPADGREMKAFIAYIAFLGEGAPQGVRVPGMGLRPLPHPVLPPDAERGRQVYAVQCARCHGADGEGRWRSVQPLDGYEAPPLWGKGSFNSTAGMNLLTTAAAFVHANMPLGVDQGAAPLSTQQAWDVAAFFTSEPRPARPPRD